MMKNKLFDIIMPHKTVSLHIIYTIIGIALGANANILHASNKVKPSPNEKVILKSLKATYKPKTVDLRLGEDGFKYYELITKDGVHFVADSVGNIIIDPKFEYTNILYIPKAENSKLDYYHSKWGYTQVILSVPVERTFIASRNSSTSYAVGDTKFPTFFYNENGELLTFYSDKLEKLGKTLFKIHHIGDDTNAYGVYGLISSDGRVIIPIEYDFVNPSSKFSELGNWNLMLNNDNIKSWGIFNIKENKFIVPCLFYNVEPIEDGNYIVKLTEYDIPETYNPSKQYKLEFNDPGEKLLYQKNYQESIAFYENNDTIKLGKILVNISYHRIAAELLDDYTRYLGFVTGNDYSVDFCDNLRRSFINFKKTINDWELFESLNNRHASTASYPKYQSSYDNALVFLNRYKREMMHMEVDVNSAIPSFYDRRRDFRISEERKRQERIREEERRIERDREKREWEDRKRKEWEDRKRKEGLKKQRKHEKASKHVTPKTNNPISNRR